MKKLVVVPPVDNHRLLPLNYEEIQSKERFIIEHYISDASYLLEIENAYVSPYGVVFKNGRAVEASIYKGFPQTNNPFYLTFVKKILLRRVRIVPELCIAALYAYYDNYYHFVCDILPRLYNAISYAPVAKVLAHERLPSFVKEYLSLLGFNKIELIKDDELAYVKKVLLPSFTSGKHSHNTVVMNGLALYLKSLVLKEPKEGPVLKNLYISRQRAKHRRVLNEEAVIHLVEAYGFAVVHFEDYTVTEQIKLMQHAKNVIGVHGAGLTNIMYMPKNGLVIEMLHPGHHIDCYYNLANVFEHDTIVLQGSAEENSTDPIHDDFSIDVSRLKHYLDHFLK
jgi:capsular polysaccharide biosynthesis protein